MKKLFITVFVSGTVLVILLEIVLRLFMSAPSQSLYSVDQQSFNEVPGIWEPGQNFVWEEVPTLPHSVKINQLGYRGEEFTRQKLPDELRVLMAGDSFVFGTNLNNDETLPVQLNQKLDQFCTNKKVNVLNAGVSGSTIQGHAEMIQRSKQLSPDIVVLLFNESDILEMVSPMWEKLADNRKAKGRFPISVLWPLLRDTAIWSLVSNTRNKQILSQDVANIEEGAALDLQRSNFKKAYLNQLNKIAAEAEEAGYGFMVAIYPGYYPLRGTPEDDTMEWAMSEIAKQGITTVNLFQDLRNSFADNIDKAYLLPFDVHPSKQAHQVAAEYIAKFMMQQKSLLGACEIPKI